MHPNTFYQAFDQENVVQRSYDASDSDGRSPFQIDRDRILHSAALRRLQGKTQVFYSFLVGEYDFYRTRLTHSLEVAQIGRSICAWLKQTSPLLKADDAIDVDLVEAACLAHDLGHPPFGHTGEKALNHLMTPYGGFEGNAQTLRLLTQTLFAERQRGMNPTRALLDAVLKYKTLKFETPDAPNHFLYDEQLTYLDFVLGGMDFPLELTPGEARNGFRSLECQIMDWADDSAYSINDLSDASQAGLITIPKLEAWAAKQSLSACESLHVEFLLDSMREGRMESRLSKCIGDHIQACSLEVRSNFMSWTSKRYQYGLVIDPDIEAKTFLNKRIAKELVFDSVALQQIDFKTSRVIENLFGALQDRYIERSSKYLHHLLPAEVEQRIDAEEDKLKRARLVCDWIANLTDRSAFRVHQRLFDTGSAAMADFL